MTKLSIIIPTYNAMRYLPKLLASLQEQTIKEYELIIIDSSSTDDTQRVAQEYTSNLIVIPKSEFDHGGTRTQAAKKATGEILVYLTQDALPVNEFSIENLLTVFQDPSIGAAYGRQLSYQNTNIFGKHLRTFNYGEKSYVRGIEDTAQYGIKTAFLSDSFAAYRRTALETIGWFKDGLILGEDTYAGAKMILNHYKLAYVANALVYHSHSYTVYQEFKRYFDIGVFHQYEHWILDEFGKAEGEGLKYIKSEINYILTYNAWYRLPEFFIRNGMKYLGYKMGQNYRKFPHKMIMQFSMHRQWWSKN